MCLFATKIWKFKEEKKFDFLTAQLYFSRNNLESFNPNPHGMFWTKVIYDLASSEPYSLSSLNSKNLKKIRKCPKRSW